jgi:hypothetical protein
MCSQPHKSVARNSENIKKIDKTNIQQRQSITYLIKMSTTTKPTQITQISAQPGDVITVGNQRAVCRRLVTSPDSGTTTTEVIENNKITTLLLNFGVPFTLERRPCLKNRNIIGYIIELGKYYAFPSILCRYLGDPTCKSLYNTSTNLDDDLNWYGQIAIIYEDGVVIKNGKNELFLTVQELRYPIDLSSITIFRTQELERLEKLYRKQSNICPGDKVALYKDRHSAALAASREQNDVVDELFTVVEIIYRKLDLPGTRVIIRGSDGRIKMVMRYILVPVEEVLSWEGRDKMYGGLTAYYSTGPGIINPPQPEGLQEPDNLESGSIIVINNIAYRVIAVAGSCYLITRVRRHPGCLIANPRIENNTWFGLTYVPRNETSLTVFREEIYNPLPDPLDMMVVRDNITGSYTIADGNPAKFSTYEDAATALRLAFPTVTADDTPTAVRLTFPNVTTVDTLTIEKTDNAQLS